MNINLSKYLRWMRLDLQLDCLVVDVTFGQQTSCAGNPKKPGRHRWELIAHKVWPSLGLWRLRPLSSPSTTTSLPTENFLCSIDVQSDVGINLCYGCIRLLPMAILPACSSERLVGSCSSLNVSLSFRYLQIYATSLSDEWYQVIYKAIGSVFVCWQC